MLGKDFVDKPVHLSANIMAPLKTTKFLPVKAQLFLVLEGKEGAASFNSNHKNGNSLPISPRADDGNNPFTFDVKSGNHGPGDRGKDLDDPYDFGGGATGGGSGSGGAGAYPPACNSQLLLTTVADSDDPSFINRRVFTLRRIRNLTFGCGRWSATWLTFLS